jgi:hypothetical protein
MDTGAKRRLNRSLSGRRAEGEEERGRIRGKGDANLGWDPAGSRRAAAEYFRHRHRPARERQDSPSMRTGTIRDGKTATAANRAGAIAAVTGGLLRVAAAFAPGVLTSPSARELLYLAVDVCLAVSLVSFYAIRRLRPAGVAGVTLALAGLAVVRLDRALPSGNLYPLAALAIAIGVIALSGSLWLERMIAGGVPLAFVLSTVLGIAGTAVSGASVLFVWSGVVFGGAFAVLGWMVGRRRTVDRHSSL